MDRRFNFRLLALQPELRRRWDIDDWNDYFVELHVHGVYYNVAWDM